MERRCVRFRGHVQGVGFRATTRWVAQRFAVTGWVRNEADGDVLVEVQGGTAEIERFLQAVRQEMAGHIAQEQTAPTLVVPEEASFEIRR